MKNDKNNKYIEKIIKLAGKAYQKGEVPVGAIIVKNDCIISSAYNEKEKSKLSTKHAEIIAIERAAKKIGDWRLAGCTMYVSLKPCQMCMGAINESRLEKVIYLAEEGNLNRNTKSVKIIKCVDKKNVKKSVDLIKDFFKSKRKENM